MLVTGLLLAGCGGGSESDDTSPPVVDETGNDDGEGSGGDGGDESGGDTNGEPVTVGDNRLGAWIFYIDEPGLVRGDHASMAEYLAELGVKRVFIKISDINYNWDANKITFAEDGVNCGEWQDACEPGNIAYYKEAGIEPWAWTYNDTHSFEEQADMLEAAVRVGYAGYVLDIEEEFNGATDTLEALLSAHEERLAMLGDLVPRDFLLTATSWGNPQDHGMRIDIIDQYVDAHMPQTYVEKWGSTFIDDIPGAIAAGDCEYRQLGATKPIWHIVSHEDKLLDADQLNRFVRFAGPHTSVWRIDDEYLAEEIESIAWDSQEFVPNECTENSFDITPQSLPASVTFRSLDDGSHYLEVPLEQAREIMAPRMRAVSTPMAQWSQQMDTAALVNAGYFTGNTPLSLVVIDGQRQADNVASLTRNGKSYPVLRSALWMNAAGEAQIGWVGVGNDGALRSFAEPMPYQRNQADPLQPPADSAGTSIEPLWAIGGGPRLVHNGETSITYDEEIFWGSGVELDDVRPRTAICVTERDSIVLYVNEGVRLDALPEKLLDLGCSEAMNLDGGGSSAMYVEGQAILDQQRAVPVVLAIRDEL